MKHRPCHSRSSSHRRRGSLIPAIAIAILVIGGCVALTLDALWLDAAHREVLTAAEAGALAGAARLAADDTLLDDWDIAQRAQAVRDAAAQVASANRAGGHLVSVDSESFGDVRLGRIVLHEQTGEVQFLETDALATSVLVTAQCDRRRGNGVSLFFAALSGQSSGDVRARAEASVNNLVIGIRPLDQAAAPIWPLAVLETHLDPRRVDTWQIQIEGRGGADRFRIDPLTGEVLEEPDGIPEILLFAPRDEDDDDRPANLALADLGNRLETGELIRQFRSGLTWHDLQDLGSELRLGNGIELDLNSTTRFPRDVDDQLQELVGQARIILLYREATLSSGEPARHLLATRLAAGRIMRVSTNAQGTEIVLQPAVITTRMALTADPLRTSENQITPNRYIHRLSLTY